MPNDPGVPREPLRVLGGVDAACVVVGAIVGVGIFFTPSRTATLVESGGLVLLAWAIAGAIALCGALTFAELGARYHASGAQYEILRDAYGALPAFLFVFCNATAIQGGAIGIIAIICAQNLGAAVGRGALEGVPLVATALALIVGLIGANIVGVRWGSRIQNLTVYAKVLTLIAVTGLALVFGRADVVGAAASEEGGGRLGPVAGVMAALVPALFAFGGWQHALWISGEVREPRRNLPRAIVGGVLLVVAVYLLANWAYLRLLGPRGVAESSALAADAAAVVMPGVGKRLIAGAVAVSALGVLNAQLLSGPRLVYAMARDGRFFGAFGRLSGRFGTPSAAIALVGGMGVALLLAAGPKGLDPLLNGVVFIDGVFFALTGAALFLLRRAGAGEGAAGGFRVPGYPVVPLLFVVGELGVVVGAYLDERVREAAVIGGVWMVVGVGVYVVGFRGRAGAAQRGTE